GSSSACNGIPSTKCSKIRYPRHYLEFLPRHVFMQPLREVRLRRARPERNVVSSATSMHFRRFRYAEMQVCFYSAAPHLHHSEAERVAKLSLERSRLPCGPDFPQTLLTCRRPVFPPDRAPMCLWVRDVPPG